MKDDGLYLEHILLAIDRIELYTRGGEAVFRAEPMVQDAVLRNLQVIGEAAKKVSAPLRSASSHVPWSDIAGLRDRVVHDYFGVSLDIVWEVIAVHLPPLRRDIEACAATLRKPGPPDAGG